MFDLLVVVIRKGGVDENTVELTIAMSVRKESESCLEFSGQDL